METREIIDYRLLIEDIGKLQYEVFELIKTKKGWQPYGPPVLASQDDYGMAFFVQAMVRYRQLV